MAGISCDCIVLFVVKLNIDRELCVRRAQTTQMNATEQSQQLRNNTIVAIANTNERHKSTRAIYRAVVFSGF
jgi:hypothetical protein